MHGTKSVLALVTATTLTLGVGIALASTDTSKKMEGSKATMSQTDKSSEVRRVRGEVTAVEPSADSMVVKAMEGKQEVTVGVDIGDKTIIRERKAHKTLADIKVGDKVWMKYERTNDKLVADYIRILRPTHVVAKAKTP